MTAAPEIRVTAEELEALEEAAELGRFDPDEAGRRIHKILGRDRALIYDAAAAAGVQCLIVTDP